ncbi:MAG: nickel-type superoxide dismutase maturation protease [Methanobacteriota archaeon]|nr:MAG: nickel-type superoxide dismutase maturation protease [Euryarchaeota archaeon]
MFPIARFRVDDRSMEPTLAPGDFVLVNRLSYRRHAPSRGDLVVVRDPQAPLRYLVKRVADVSVSGAFVVGDNQTPSRDSRTFGPVPKEFIVGRVWRTAKP